jgi:hypothetical protein
VVVLMHQPGVAIFLHVFVIWEKSSDLQLVVYKSSLVDYWLREGILMMWEETRDLINVKGQHEYTVNEKCTQ